MTAYYINVHHHVFPNDIERTSSPPLYGYTMRSRDSFKIIIRYESRVQEIVKNGCDLRDGNSLDAGKQAGEKIHSRTEPTKEEERYERSLTLA